MRRNLTITMLVSLGVVLSVVGGHAAKVSTISKQKAIRQAVTFTGFSEKYIISATQAIVSDPSAQVFPIEKRPVWEVTFDKVYLSVSAPGQKPVYNPDLHTVITWIDAETGALINLFPPPSLTGGIELMVGKQQRGWLTSNGVTFTTTPTKPDRPFLSMLAPMNTKQRDVVMQAKEIVAYYGLVTDTMGTPEEQLKDRPAWFVFFGGVDQIFSSSGPDVPPDQIKPTPPKATEVMLLMDAIDSRCHFTYLSGGPVEQATEDKSP